MSTKKNIAPEFTDDVDKVEQIAEVAEVAEVADGAVVEEATPEVDELPTVEAESAKKAVKFVKSPMGYNLSYNIGDVAELPEAQADYLIKLQIAELC